MTKNTTLSEQLIAEFAGSYLEKLFYFCLKKTGNQVEAEDLTQDIALNILTALNNGTIPTGFSAWVWRIARNRYAAWADGKHRRSESVTGADIGDYAIADEGQNPLDRMICSEQLALLRRELAFIEREYRNIVIAHYFEKKRVREIAEALSLSEGAVKQRLYRARNKLKEGMNMAREFGVRSYRPEEICYSMCFARHGDKKQPNSIMAHKLYENIFLEAYGNPSSAEALSLELGVALPYMEDELEFLTRESFLCCRDGKYQTAFPIVSREAQEAIHCAQLTAAPALTRALVQVIDRLNSALTAQGYAYYGTAQDYESAKWTLLMLAEQHFANRTTCLPQITKRPDNGEWDILGYQRCGVEKPALIGNQVRRGEGFMLHQFSFSPTETKLTDADARVLYAAATGQISDADNETATGLVETGYLRQVEGAYAPAILILSTSRIKQAVRRLDASVAAELTALADNARAQFEALYRTVSEIVRADLPPLFAADAYQCAMAVEDGAFSRGYVLAEALRQGYLRPTSEVSRAIGVHLDLL